MKAVVQRVDHAECRVNDKSVGSIQQGLVIFLGIAEGDSDEEIEALVNKIVTMRVFGDDEGKLENDCSSVGAELLLIPNFTLYADMNQGRRPDFNQAAAPDRAESLYDKFLNQLQDRYPAVEAGEFGAMMTITVENDGPVTLVLNSENLKTEKA